MGIEVERFLLDSEGRRLSYSQGVESFLTGLKDKQAWNLYQEDQGRPLGLVQDEDFISLEPGAQLEVALSAQANLVAWGERSEAKEKELSRLFQERGESWLWLGCDPWNSVEDIELIPSARYQIMTDYYRELGLANLEMMRLTAGFHVNLDYRNETEAMEMLQAGAYLAPLWAAWFANSPFLYGKRMQAHSQRSLIWLQHDASRSGFFLGQKIEDYVNLVESTPLMFVYLSEGRVEAGKGRAWRDLPTELQELNLLTSLRQLFLEVRLKPCCVEFRSFDACSPSQRLAAAALCIGIFYDEENRRHYAKKAQAMTKVQLTSLFESAAIQSFEQDFFVDWAKDVLDRATSALVRRSFGEEQYLVEAERLLSLKKSPAMILKEKWKSFPVWNSEEVLG